MIYNALVLEFRNFLQCWRYSRFKTCCCICANRHNLHKHPWNNNFGKGSFLDHMGYVCFIDDGEKPRATYFDHEHGMCEMFREK